MFDIGFWELGVIGVIALMVIGPERLPGLARSIGEWVGKAKRFVSYVQADIKQELGKTEQLQQLLKEQSEIKEIHEIIEQAVDDTKGTIAVGTPISKHKVKSLDSVSTQQDTTSNKHAEHDQDIVEKNPKNPASQAHNKKT